MLTLSRWWRRRDGQGWRWYLKDLIKNAWYVTKYTWQRGRNGWAYPDTWQIEHWFACTLPPMLRHLADRYEDPEAVIGIQEAYYNNPERWAAVLRQMADDLEAPMKVEEQWIKPDYGSFDMLSDAGVDYKAIYDLWHVAEAKAYARQKAGVAAFAEYFFELGD